MGMPLGDLYFSADLRTPSGVEAGELLPFPSLEAVCCDIYASIPEIAADLLRTGVNPMACEYQVRDALGNVVVEIPFFELLRGRSDPPPASRCSDEEWGRIVADLRQRSEEAMERLDRATAWMNRITARALSIGRHAP